MPACPLTCLRGPPLFLLCTLVRGTLGHVGQLIVLIRIIILFFVLHRRRHKGSGFPVGCRGVPRIDHTCFAYEPCTIIYRSIWAVYVCVCA
jgi:hypothetical protein